MNLSRREFQLGVAATLGLAASGAAWAQDAGPDPRAAIIDTNDDIHKLLAAIGNDPKNKGLEIVARYYARKCQPGWFPFKRFAKNEDKYVCGENRWKGASERDLLFSKGLAILSVYQFNSSDPSKFLFGLGDVQDAIRKSGKPAAIAAPEAEAEADADAVVDQSKAVNQPEQSAIYFGVDFDLRTSGPVKTLRGAIVKDRNGRPVTTQQALDAVMVYFSRLKALLGDRLGAYGNGHTNRALRADKITKYSWVSESRSFLETPEYLADRDPQTTWHLFQHQIDRRWPNGFSLDANVQNPKVAGIGAWNAQGPYEVSAARTQEIFAKRWVALRDGIGVFDASGRQLPLKGHDGLQRNRAVRVVRDLGDRIEVDIDDDGVPEGFCHKKDPKTSKPNFVESIFEMPKW